jgi:hypothetical protein
MSVCNSFTAFQNNLWTTRVYDWAIDIQTFAEVFQDVLIPPGLNVSKGH